MDRPISLNRSLHQGAVRGKYPDHRVENSKGCRNLRSDDESSRRGLQVYVRLARELEGTQRSMDLARLFSLSRVRNHESIQRSLAALIYHHYRRWPRQQEAPCRVYRQEITRHSNPDDLQANR